MFMYIDWQAVAAVGTWAAVLVALFLPYWQNRRKVVISIQPDMCAYSPGEKRPVMRYIGVSCVNRGSADIVIRNFAVRVENGKAPIYLSQSSSNSLYSQMLSFATPYRLPSLDCVTCGFEKGSLSKSLQASVNSGEIQVDDTLSVVFSDTMGHKYIKPLYCTVQDCIEDGKKNV